MLEITNYRNGQIVNRNHGTETAQSLTVTVEGLADCAGRVLLNGQPVTACGKRFHGDVTLDGSVQPRDSQRRYAAG